MSFPSGRGSVLSKWPPAGGQAQTNNNSTTSKPKPQPISGVGGSQIQQQHQHQGPGSPTSQAKPQPSPRLSMTQAQSPRATSSATSSPTLPSSPSSSISSNSSASTASSSPRPFGGSSISKPGPTAAGSPTWKSSQPTPSISSTAGSKAVNKEDNADAFSSSTSTATSSTSSSSKMNKSGKTLSVLVVTGFYGSGKTTVVRRLLLPSLFGAEAKAGEQSEPFLALRFALLFNTTHSAAGTIDAHHIRNGWAIAGQEGSLEVLQETTSLSSPAGMALLSEQVQRLVETKCEYLIIENEPEGDPLLLAKGFSRPIKDGRALESTARLDAMVTVVSCVDFIEMNSSDNEQMRQVMHKQISFADMILLTKADLVSADELSHVQYKLRELNKEAFISIVDHGKLRDNKNILFTGLYTVKKAARHPKWENAENGGAGELCKHGFLYRARQPFHPQRIQKLFASQADDLINITRIKGIIWLASRYQRYGLWSRCASENKPEVSGEGNWIIDTPKEQWSDWEAKEAESWGASRTGDRRQEISFISQTLVNQTILCKLLDACLVKSNEIELDINGRPTDISVAKLDDRMEAWPPARQRRGPPNQKSKISFDNFMTALNACLKRLMTLVQNLPAQTLKADASTAEKVKLHIRYTAMETYKLVGVIVKPFLEEQLWRAGLNKRLRKFESLTQDLQQAVLLVIRNSKAVLNNEMKSDAYDDSSKKALPRIEAFRDEMLSMAALLTEAIVKAEKKKKKKKEKVKQNAAKVESCLDTVEIAVETGDKETFEKATREAVQSCGSIAAEAARLKLADQRLKIQQLVDEFVVTSQSLQVGNIDIGDVDFDPSNETDETEAYHQAIYGSDKDSKDGNKDSHTSKAPDADVASMSWQQAMGLDPMGTSSPVKSPTLPTSSGGTTSANHPRASTVIPSKPEPDNKATSPPAAANARASTTIVSPRLSTAVPPAASAKGHAAIEAAGIVEDSLEDEGDDSKKRAGGGGGLQRKLTRKFGSPSSSNKGKEQGQGQGQQTSKKETQEERKMKISLWRTAKNKLNEAVKVSVDVISNKLKSEEAMDYSAGGNQEARDDIDDGEPNLKDRPAPVLRFSERIEIVASSLEKAVIDFIKVANRYTVMAVDEGTLKNTVLETYSWLKSSVVMTIGIIIKIEDYDYRGTSIAPEAITKTLNNSIVIIDKSISYKGVANEHVIQATKKKDAIEAMNIGDLLFTHIDRESRRLIALAKQAISALRVIKIAPTPEQATILFLPSTTNTLSSSIATLLDLIETARAVHVNERLKVAQEEGMLQFGRKGRGNAQEEDAAAAKLIVDDDKDDVNIWDDETEPIMMDASQPTAPVAAPSSPRLHESQQQPAANEDEEATTPRQTLQIRAASLNKLVQTLTSDEVHDARYIAMFITTYRSFTTPHKLFKKLVQRYRVPTSGKHALPAARAAAIQGRVCVVLKYWLEKQFVDFDSQLSQQLGAFIHELASHSDKTIAFLGQALKRLVEAHRHTSLKRYALPTHIKVPYITSLSRLFLEMKSVEVAEQITLIDFEMLKNIQPSELLNGAWNKESLKHRSPNLMALINRANSLSFWVAGLILMQPTFKMRKKMFTKFVLIAAQFKQQHNYNSLMSVIVGLNTSAISRLKAVKEEKSVKLLQQLEDLMNPEGSFKKYREILYSSPPPRIPFLGVCLSDLTFLEDGNQDFLGDGLINIHKRRMVYKAIEEVQQCQLMPFTFERKEIHELLTELPVLSENDLFALSLAREPREKPKTAALRRLASVRGNQDNSFQSQAARHIESAEAVFSDGGRSTSSRIKSTTISPSDSPNMLTSSMSATSPPTSPRGNNSSVAGSTATGAQSTGSVPVIRGLKMSGGSSVTLSPRSMTLTPRSNGAGGAGAGGASSLSAATGSAMRSPPTSPRSGNGM